MVIHSIADESITRQRVCGIACEFRASFVTLTADYRYLIIVGYEINSWGHPAERYRYDIYVMALQSRDWQFRRCDIDILYNDCCYFAVSCKWNLEEIAVIVDGYFRERHLSHNENVRVLPVEMHNVIINYISIQELLHYIGKGVHFAISFRDILD